MTDASVRDTAATPTARPTPGARPRSPQAAARSNARAAVSVDLRTTAGLRALLTVGPSRGPIEHHDLLVDHSGLTGDRHAWCHALDSIAFTSERHAVGVSLVRACAETPCASCAQRVVERLTPAVAQTTAEHLRGRVMAATLRAYVVLVCPDLAACPGHDAVIGALTRQDVVDVLTVLAS